MRLHIIFLILCSLLLVSNASNAVTMSSFSTMPVNDSATKLTLYLPLEANKGLSVKQVKDLAPQQWQKVSSQEVTVNAGNNWLKVELYNALEQTVDNHLVIDGRQFLYQHIIYQDDAKQQITDKNRLLPSTKQINNVVTSQITLSANETVTLLVKLSSHANRTVQIRTLNQYRFTHYIGQDSFISGLAIGGLIAMVFMLLFIFLSTTNYEILLLASYLAALAGSLAAMYGVNFSILLPQYTSIHGQEFPLFTALSAILILWFCSELFKLADNRRYLYWAYHLIGWSLLVFIGVSFFLSFNDNVLISNVIKIVSTLFLAALALHLAQQKHQLTALFSSFVIVQGFIVFTNVGLYDWYHLNTELYTVGYWITGLLIVFILGRQSHHEKYEKYAARQQALASAVESKKAQEELLVLQNENQEQLELAVQERTLELNIALQELEDANRELEQKNTQDELTGLFNRRHYDQKLLAEFRRSRRNLTPLSLVVIDIDHFKAINDKYGHTAGDVCLVTLAQLMKKILRRSSDLGFRYGGEEFCLILPETDPEGAIALAEALRNKVLETAFSIETEQLSLTISCGVVTYQQQADVTPVEIFNIADQALYLAKTQGRNRVIAKAIESDTSNT
ncbi:diguanylate cyclase [Thalassotalea sp. 1_MG-2023]|uniref:sensor domain-containing diguanylate cyclase n=1 Tax=Thalassotalea sp. 1_MG-2023 TaxID=3062680 RepID=UPI0026E40F98|nr:diguanylate cyclase [Thalassotalea sp. 1_MG-2023]MDO6425936.1 diguanylate cyclase [Thalassotalea sp. 1_MG-2023]